MLGAPGHVQLKPRGRIEGSILKSHGRADLQKRLADFSTFAHPRHFPSDTAFLPQYKDYEEATKISDLFFPCRAKGTLITPAPPISLPPARLSDFSPCETGKIGNMFKEKPFS